MTNPTFGEEPTTVDHKARYGVYAVVPNTDKSQVILIQAPNGSWFLLGGEIEVGGDRFSALKRELIEELDFPAGLGCYYGQADEYFYSRHRDTHFCNPAYIHEVTHLEEIDAPLEDLNSLSWSPINEATKKLKHGSHKRGVEAWKENRH